MLQTPAVLEAGSHLIEELILVGYFLETVIQQFRMTACHWLTVDLWQRMETASEVLVE